jgi:hypothetical protein
MIDLRNAFVKFRPEERAFISYLEMRTIGIFYMFGKSNRQILYPGVSIGKKIKKIPESLPIVGRAGPRDPSAIK